MGKAAWKTREENCYAIKIPTAASLIGSSFLPEVGERNAVAQ